LITTERRSRSARPSTAVWIASATPGFYKPGFDKRSKDRPILSSAVGAAGRACGAL
jgi:hypothetical protein